MEIVNKYIFPFTFLINMQILDLFSSYYLITFDELDTPFNFRDGEIIKYGKISNLQHNHDLLRKIIPQSSITHLFYNYLNDEYDLKHPALSIWTLPTMFENYILIKT